MKDHKYTFALFLTAITMAIAFALNPQSAYAACGGGRGQTPCPPEKRKTSTSLPPTFTPTSTLTPTFTATFTPTLVVSSTPTPTSIAIPQGGSAGGTGSQSPAIQNPNPDPEARVYGQGSVFPWSEGSFWGNIFSPGLLILVLLILVLLIGLLSLLNSNFRKKDDKHVRYGTPELTFHVDEDSQNQPLENWTGGGNDNTMSPNAGGVAGSIISVDGLEHSHETVEYKDPDVGDAGVDPGFNPKEIGIDKSTNWGHPKNGDGFPLELGSTTHVMLHDGDANHQFSDEDSPNTGTDLKTKGGRPKKK